MKRPGHKKALADSLGVSKITITDIMSGKKNASPGLAKKINRKIGGGLLVWIYPERAEKRIEIFNRFFGESE